jgi:DNA-binding SARP family transcriptional activator
MVPVAAARAVQGTNPFALDVRLLGRFVIAAGDRSTGPWPRPSARRLCQLVLISPARRLSRDAACEALFPSLRSEAATNALWKALSMARSVLGQLGPPAAGLLCADHGQIWAATEVALEVDLDAHEQALQAALRASPGPGRDRALAGALATGGVLLADEPAAEWAVRVRERLEDLRQEARLELARDRARGAGRARPEEVLQAWQACLEADPTCEEAAAALVRLYVAQARRPQAFAVYERCAAALGRLGLKVSPALGEARAAAEDAVPFTGRGPAPSADVNALGRGGERRLVSVVVVELSPAGLGPQAGRGTHPDPEDLRELTGAGLAEAMAEAEAFGGTVASISPFGLSVIFGAPQAHEDDPERALRSAWRTVAAVGSTGMALSVRVGVETGPAVVGPVGAGTSVGYGAVGEVVETAAALQSVARPGSVLVGPATRAATEGIFEWGPGADVLATPGTKPLAGTYLVQPRARPLAEAGRRRLAARAPLVGRDAELALLTEAVRATVSGRGGVVLIVGEPGLGKTRLVAECRKYFMGWAGAASGRLPLWLEGRCASYASSTPYGAYQQLLSRFVGAPPEAGEAVLRPALEAAVRAVLGKDSELVPVLAHMMGLPPGPGGADLARMSPAELQHLTFSAMSSLLTRLVEHGPTVLALEDLHWADPTSLRLTANLAHLANTGPLLVLATRRPEPDPGAGELEAELAADPGRPVRALPLAPIGKPAERALARSMLGGEAGDEVIEVVCDGVDGNPLFLEERLASLRDTGALAREGTAWRLGRAGALPLGEALERLVRSRIDRLSPGAREAVVAASVLGEELECSALGAVSELGSELDGALAELVSAGLLTEARSQPERLYRFRHAVIRDAAYNGLLRAQRRQLHARAAWDLEARATDRLEAVAAVLGRHFAAAGERDRAVHYLEMAGDHAARAFANEEAIVSYRQALALLGEEQEGHDTVVGGPARSAAAALGHKLAFVLMTIDRLGEAEAAARAGLAQVGAENALQAARLQHLLGKIEFQELRFDAALAADDAAQALIGPVGLDDDQERVELWLTVQLSEKAAVQCWRHELGRSAALIESARPLVEARGSEELLAHFYWVLAMQHLAERRYRVDDEVVEDYRRAMGAARASAPANYDLLRPDWTLRFTMSVLAVALTWHGDLAEARQLHEEALAMGERQGSPMVRGEALAGLAVIAMRQGEVEVVRDLAPQARAEAAAGSSPSCVAAAIALQAWVAWRDHRVQEALVLGAEALEAWDPHPYVYPYKLALWPLAGAYLDVGQVPGAVGAARRLLEPSHARLPDELEAAVQAACEAWDRAEPELAGRLLAEAVELARDLGYA